MPTDTETSAAARDADAQPRDGGVVVSGVHKDFGAVRALDGVSLDIPAGGIVAVVGPSGCGGARAVPGHRDGSPGPGRLGTPAKRTPARIGCPSPSRAAHRHPVRRPPGVRAGAC